MKLIRSFFVFIFSIFICYSANAQKTVQVQTQSDRALKQFSESIALKFEGIQIKDLDDRTIVSFKYIVENTSKKTINQLQWETTYFYQDVPILLQNVPVSIKGGLKPKESIPLFFSIPFDNLPQQAQEALSIQDVQISARFVAKKIVFSNGSKIEVK